MGNPRRGNGARRRSVVRWLRSQALPCHECDELVPVSRGGSPYDRANVAAAHRCCNNWRGNRGMGEVVAMRRALAARGLAWSSPQEFVALARGVRSGRKAVQMGPARTTTEW